MTKDAAIPEAARLYKKALRRAKDGKAAPEIVLPLLEKAVELGNPDAAYALASWHWFGKNVKKDAKKAVELLKIAAKANAQHALLNLGMSYEKGSGVDQDLPRAFEYYLMAAIRGDKKAIHEVGRCYWHGIGIKKDRKLAKIWLDAADAVGASRS